MEVDLIAHLFATSFIQGAPHVSIDGISSRLFSRRRFFRWASSLMAALGGAPLVSSAKTLSSRMQSTDGEDYYAKLGVATIINAAGTYTMLTAACMPPEVLAAVQKAALHPVRLHDLQRKAGEYISRRLKCEGAVVTSGASGAISLATAACMQHANNINIFDMPQAIEGNEKSGHRTAGPPL